VLAAADQDERNETDRKSHGPQRKGKIAPKRPRLKSNRQSQMRQKKNVEPEKSVRNILYGNEQ